MLNDPLIGFIDAVPVLAQSGPSSSRGLLVLAAIGGGAAVGLLYIILFGQRSGSGRGLGDRLGVYGDPQQALGRFGKIPLLRKFAFKAEKVAQERGVLTMIATALEQANAPLKPGEAITVAIGAAGVLGGLILLVTGDGIVAVMATVLSLVVLGVLVQFVAARERRKFENQLPDTINLIATSLRAGYSLLQSVEAVGTESSEPTRREFTRAITETRLGRSPVVALQQVADRMESKGFEWVVLAINIQREVGGNLAEVLQTTAETMVERTRLQREMKALTAEGRISAIVLGAMPVALFGFLFTTNRSYLDPLLSSLVGQVAIGGALVSLVLGMFWLKKIVTVDI